MIGKRLSRKVEVRVTEEIYNKMKDLVEEGCADDISDYVRRAVEYKIMLDREDREPEYAVCVDQHLIRDIEGFLRSNLAKMLGISNDKQLVSHPIKFFLRTNRLYLDRTSDERVFIRVEDLYYVTICTERPGLASHWRLLLQAAYGAGTIINTVFYKVIEPPHQVKEAYLVANTTYALFIIGKFTGNSTSSKIELSETLELIKQLRIPLETRPATDPSFQKIHHAYTTAEQEEKTLPHQTARDLISHIMQKTTNTTPPKHEKQKENIT
ncbi:MAG: hypothetical protein QXX57_02525 [Nitrososphaerota archaeon]